MMNKTLRKQVLLGLFSLTVGWGIGFQAPIVHAQTSLYDEYQAQQKLEKSAPSTEAYEKHVAEPADHVDAAEPESALSFTQRIQSLLDEYHTNRPHGDYSRFLTPPKTPADLKDEADLQAAKTAKAADASARTVAASAPVTSGTFTTGPVPVQPTPNLPAVTAPASGLPSIPAGTDRPAVAEGTYNFDWRGTPLAQSLYTVARIAHKGVVINGDLKGDVYVSLHGVTCNQVLDYLSAAYNFNWMNDGNNFIISTDKLMKQSKVIKVNYINKAKAKEELTALGIDAANIYANDETGTITVTGSPYEIQQAVRHMKEIDRPVAQCLLVAQLIEISHGKSLDLGMSYNLPLYSHAADDDLKGPWLEKLTFSSSVTASRELNKGRVISRPMTLAQNGQEAKVLFGDRVPVFTSTNTTTSTDITVTYENVGTSLTMTPIINEETGDISLKLTAEVSNITGYITNQSGTGRAPQIATRDVTTSAHVKSGQSFIIGGLMSEQHLDNLSGIPGLMNLPILGQLFRYHQKSTKYDEVFIMITPYIVTDGMNPEEILRKAAAGDKAKEARENDK
ncbi:type II secretion system protein GspD [uncultured Mitsuokella sp.]|uniref:type II secretion system protein GspD n=1 Tax=uncultured Mitsuokella sp. TaxID=453120 RepID=UPI0026DC2DEF|nr:secretin N-terminal domain-containing protein [uncultured Mitsuokella sp.]